MKIDEVTIDHNAMQLITDTVRDPYEYWDLKESVLAALFEVSRILKMAETMKEVLKA